MTPRWTPLKWMAVLAVALLASQASAVEKPALKTQKDKVSYGIGLSIGKNLREDGIDVNLDFLMKGLKDALAGAKLLMTDEEINSTMTTFTEELREKQAQARQKHIQALQKQAEENKKAGEAFLSENKKKQGVITLPSGLQYKVLTAGTGKRPAANDTVQCNYRGTLINGTEFDSSYKRGKPGEFNVSGIIAGWKEALQLMPVGSKWQLFIPASLAYGEQIAGDFIGPNSTLIFEVELLSIKEPSAAPAPTPAPEGK